MPASAATVTIVSDVPLFPVDEVPVDEVPAATPEATSIAVTYPESALCSEWDLVLRARGGDEWAFRQLWALAERRVFAVCLHLSGHRVQALDAVQDTQIAVWRNLHRFAGRSSFATWACAIARNAVHELRRSAVARREEPHDPTTPSPSEPGRWADAGFENWYAQTDAVRRVLAELRKEHREALLLWAGGMSYPELAATFGAPVNTVRVWVHRAREQVRAGLGTAN